MTAPTIPTTSAELEEELSDVAKVQQHFTNGTFKDLIKAYADSVAIRTPDLAAQIREQLQIAMASYVTDLGGKPADNPIPLNANPLDGAHLNRDQRRRNGLYNKKAPGAKLAGKFDDTADFLQAIWHRADTLPNSKDLAPKLAATRDIMNAFGSQVPGDGGFLVPEEMRSQLLEWSLESSVVRPRATIIPMSSLRVPIPMVDSTTNATSVFGGLIFYWTEEGATLTDTSATFGQVVLDAKKLTGFSGVPNELVADAPAFNGFIDRVFPQGLAFYEDKAFFGGSGVGEPIGFINNAAAVSVAKETGQLTKTVLWENCAKMYSRMLPSSLANAVWIVSPDVLSELLTMALSVGTGGSSIFVITGSEAMPMSILGRPLIVSEKASALGTTGDINFVDLSYYLIGDRQVMTADSSPHYLFGNDKTAFRIIQRVDGRPWLQSAITPANGSSNTLSPFVQLATR
jgi:HK97 family phage major capsid protein